jgi:hypothetical protein
VLTKAFKLETKTNPKSSWAIRWREWFSNLFADGIPQIGAACAALVAMLDAYALGVQMLHLRARVSELEAQASRNGQQTSQSAAAQTAKVEELNRQVAEERSKRKAPLIHSFVLAPGLTKDLDGPKPLMIGEGAQLWSQNATAPL